MSENMRIHVKNVLAGIGTMAILAVALMIAIPNFANYDLGSTGTDPSLSTDITPTDGGVVAESPDGALSCGPTGKEFPNLNSPSAPAFSNGGLTIIANGGNGTVDVYNANGKLKGTITGLKNPSSVVLDSSDNLYVADFGNNKVYKYIPDNQSGSGYKKDSKEYSIAKPESLLISNNNMYAISNKSKIMKTVLSGSTFVSFSSYTSDIRGIAVGKDVIYATDLFNSKVVKFDLNGNKTKEWGKFGQAEGYFDFPTGIAYDGTYVYVADSGNHRIQIFTKDGDFVTIFKGKYDNKDKFGIIKSLSIGNNGLLYVVPDGNGVSISEFSFDCGKITVKKDYIPGTNTQDFNFTLVEDSTRGLSSDFILDDDGENTKKALNQETFAVGNGTYYIREWSEDLPFNVTYECKSATNSFSGKGNSIEVKIINKENYICVVKNTKKGYIPVYEEAEPYKPPINP